MVWGAFSGYDKCSLVIVPSSKKTAVDFVDFIYKGALLGFYFLHDRLNSRILMDDGASLHRSILPQRWTKAHDTSKLDDTI